MKPPPLGLTARGHVVSVESQNVVDLWVASQRFRLRFLDAATWGPSLNCQTDPAPCRELVSQLHPGRDVIVFIATRHDASIKDTLAKGFGHGLIWLPGHSESLGKHLVRNGFAHELHV